MAWQRWRFKGNKVYARVGAKDQLLPAKGRVEIRYKLDDPRAYRVNPSSLQPLPAEEGGDRLWPDGDAAPVDPASRPEVLGREETASGEDTAGTARDSRPPGTPSVGVIEKTLLPSGSQRTTLLNDKPPIVIFTDGSCQGNPGPSGIGIVMTCAGRRREHSEYLGQGTNNTAELTAILRALELVKDPDRTVILYTDSQYSIGVLGGWKAKANQDIIEQIKRARTRFPDLRLRKVAGHSGNIENERCDELAKDAIHRHAARAPAVPQSQDGATGRAATSPVRPSSPESSKG